MLIFFLILCSIACDIIDLSSRWERKTQYIIYHNEVSRLDVHLSDNPDELFDVKIKCIDLCNTDDFCFENLDIIKPYVLEVSYSINPGGKLFFDLFDENNNFLFRCTIVNVDTRMNRTKDIFFFTNGQWDTIENINSYLLMNRTRKYIFNDTEYDAWVVGDNELILAKLDLSCTTYESISLAGDLKMNTDMIYRETISSFKMQELEIQLSECEKYTLAISRCFFAINNFIHKNISLYENINLTEEFLVNKTTSDEERRFMKTFIKLLEDSIDFLRSSYEEFNKFINETTSFDSDVKEISSLLIDKVLNKLDDYHELIKNRIEDTERTLNERTLKTDNVRIQNETFHNHNRLFYLLLAYLKINKQCQLMYTEESIYDVITDSLISEIKYINFDIYELTSLERATSNLERFLLQPSQANLQRLLANTKYKELTINKMLSDLQNIKYHIETRQTEFVRFVTDDFINYDTYLNQVINVIDLVKDFLNMNSTESRIDMSTIILSLLRNQ